jgi:hypothetical protein
MVFMRSALLLLQTEKRRGDKAPRRYWQNRLDGFGPAVHPSGL